MATTVKRWTRQHVASAPDQRASRTTDTIAQRWVPVATAVGLIGLALTHLLDLPDKLGETPWQGWAFLVLSVGSLALAWLVVRAPDRSVYLAAGAIAGLTLLGYVLSRTTGLPGDAEEIGNWFEPLGVISVVSELLVVGCAAYAVGRTR